jgi:phage major head subunit gpT-like protein
MNFPKTEKVRRNIYMGQEYLDLEAIVVQERKRTGRNVSVADLVRKACQDYSAKYWTAVATARSE